MLPNQKPIKSGFGIEREMSENNPQGIIYEQYNGKCPGADN
jgi:hypothetical protein